LKLGRGINWSARPPQPGRAPPCSESHASSQEVGARTDDSSRRPVSQRVNGIPTPQKSVMRKVIACNIVSLDGSYEGPGSNVMSLAMDEPFDAYNRQRIEAAGTVLLGRTSYQGFSSHWLGVTEAPADPNDRVLSEDDRALGRAYPASRRSSSPMVTPQKWQPLARHRHPGSTRPGRRVNRAGPTATGWRCPDLRQPDLVERICWTTGSSTSCASWSPGGPGRGYPALLRSRRRTDQLDVPGSSDPRTCCTATTCPRIEGDKSWEVDAMPMTSMR
jgi:hypothetical protein